jgi:hypothetical protein
MFFRVLRLNPKTPDASTLHRKAVESLTIAEAMCRCTKSLSCLCMKFVKVSWSIFGPASESTASPTLWKISVLHSRKPQTRG